MYKIIAKNAIKLTNTNIGHLPEDSTEDER